MNRDQITGHVRAYLGTNPIVSKGTLIEFVQELQELMLTEIYYQVLSEEYKSKYQVNPEYNEGFIAGIRKAAEVIRKGN